MTALAPPLADLTPLARDLRDVASFTKHAREMLDEGPTFELLKLSVAHGAAEERVAGRMR